MRHPLMQAAIEFLKARGMRAAEGAVHAVAEDAADIADGLGSALKDKAREIRDRNIVVGPRRRGDR